MSKQFVSVTTNADSSNELFYPRINVIATGKNLQRIRLSYEFTQSYVASQLGKDGISPAAISQWENGKCMPDMDNLVILCCLYGNCTFDDLIVLDYPKKEAS